MFGVLNLFQLDPVVVQDTGHRIGDPEVEHGIAEASAHEELQRQVADAPRVFLFVGEAGFFPALHQPVAHGVGERFIQVMARTVLLVPAQGAIVIAQEILIDGVFVHRQGWQFGQFRVRGKYIAQIIWHSWVTTPGVNSGSGHSVRMSHHTGTLRLDLPLL